MLHDFLTNCRLRRLKVHWWFKLNIKRSIGHIAHLRKQFNSIKRYDYHYHYVNWEKKNPLFFLYQMNGSSFKQTWIHFIQGCFVPNLVKIAPPVLEKEIFNFVKAFSVFAFISPWKLAGHFIWRNLNPL